MNLRQLRYFLVVAQELHFGRAAKQLHMAQPPLSMQIKQLEGDLGVLLFERTKRRVSLTAAGEVLRSEAQPIFEQLELARRKTQQAARGAVGEVAIAFVSSAMYSVLPPWINAFSQQYPQVNLTLKEQTTTEQIARLLARQIDIGFVRPPVNHAQLESQCVWQEPLLVALPERHALSHEAEISIAALGEEDFVLFPRGLATALYDSIISFCQQAQFSPKIVQTASQLQTLLGLVSAQLGVAILPAAAQKLHREGVCYLPFIEETPTTELHMVWRVEEASPVVANFLSLHKILETPH